MQQKRLTGAELEERIHAVCGALVRRFSPEKIILFGSFARGDQNRASDLDLVIIAPTALSFCDRIGEALASCHAAGRGLPVEPLVYTPDEWSGMLASGNVFATQVLREGRVLHDRESQSDRSAALAQAGPA